MLNHRPVDYRKRQAVIAAYERHQPVIERMLELKRRAEVQTSGNVRFYTTDLRLIHRRFVGRRDDK